jgi:hypothetical protein
MLQTELSLSLGDEIAVLSWNHFYCQWPTTLFHNRKLHLCSCTRLSSRSLIKIGAEIAVLSRNHFYCQGTTALFLHPETAPLHMRQTEFAISWQVRC